MHVVVEPDQLREPVLDTALSRALFQRVAAGELPATLRLTRPAPAVVFGKQDRVAPGYGAAVEAARAHGFEAVLRVAGGRAAVFHDGALALAHIVPDPEPRKGIHARFEASAALIEAALRRVGVDARVGEVPGEYCPGSYSVNAGGERKLAGLGQRLVKGASYMGGVLVVSDSAAVRAVLVPVYDTLGIAWEPNATGAVAEEPGFDPPAAAPAAKDRFAERPVESSFGGRPVESSFGGRPVERSFGERPVESSFGERPVERSFGERPVESSFGGRSAGGAAERAWATVVDALLAGYARHYELVETELDAETFALAERLLPEHRAG